MEFREEPFEPTDAGIAVSDDATAPSLAHQMPLTRQLFKLKTGEQLRRVEDLMTCVLALQWMAAVMVLMGATWLWEGAPRSSFPFWISLVGAFFTGGPLVMVARRGGTAASAYSVALGQMLWAALSVHVSGGTLEAFIHVGGSLLLVSLLLNKRLLLICAGVPVVHLAINWWCGHPAAHFGLLEFGAGLEQVFWLSLLVAWLSYRINESQRTLWKAASAESDLAEERRRTDIEIEKLNTALDRASVFHQRLLESVDGEACVVDRHGVIMLANGRWQKAWEGRAEDGSDERDSLSRFSNVFDVSRLEAGPWGDHQDRAQDEIRAVLTGKKTRSVVELPLNEHQIIELAVDAAAMLPSGERGAVVSRRDVSARAGLSKDLAEATERLRILEAAVQCTQQALVVTDLQGHATWINDRFEQLTCFTQQELLGRELHRHIASHDSNPDAMAALDDGFALQCGCEVAIRCLRKDDAAFDAIVRLEPMFNDEQEVTHFVAMYQDTTLARQRDAEFRQLQSHLAEATRRATAAAFTNDSLQIVSDALTNVSIASELVANRLKASSVRRLSKASRMIESNLDNLPAFIQHDEQGQHLPEFLGAIAARLSHENNMLQDEMRSVHNALAEARELVAEQQRNTRVAEFLEPVHVNQLVEDAVMTMTKSDTHAFRVDLDLDESLPEMSVDRRKILQVLINLLANARHAVRNVANPSVMLKTTLEGDRAVVEITDNGCGIDKEDLRRIFRRGFSKWREGRGYGLFCSAQVADELNGSLRAYSEGESLGATFRLELPVRVSEPDFSMASSVLA